MSEKDPSENPRIKRVTLPSGRVVSVIQFHVEPEPEQDSGLHICPHCGSKFVQPTAAHENEHKQSWYLRLECPECPYIDEGDHTSDEVGALETVLDDGLAEMIYNLRKISKINAHEEEQSRLAEINRFVIGLATNLISARGFLRAFVAVLE